MKDITASQMKEVVKYPNEKLLCQIQAHINLLKIAKPCKFCQSFENSDEDECEVCIYHATVFDDFTPIESFLTESSENIKEEKTFECDVCHKKFASDNAVVCHKKAKHKILFLCKVCNINLKTDKELEQHNKSKAHQEKLKRIKFKDIKRYYDLVGKDEVVINERDENRGNR